jgi:hypothetical protein
MPHHTTRGITLLCTVPRHSALHAAASALYQTAVCQHLRCIKLLFALYQAAVALACIWSKVQILPGTTSLITVSLQCVAQFEILIRGKNNIPEVATVNTRKA